MKHDEVPPHLEFAPLTYMAGYLAFVCEQKVSSSFFNDPAYSMISHLNDGQVEVIYGINEI